MIRKADIILAVVLIVLGLAVSYAFSAGDSAGETVHILVDGDEYGYYSLLEDRTITIAENDHINKITIKNGTVSMTFSDCTNQDCVLHSPIHRTGETIVCLPHKLVVEITGDDYEFDAISK